MEIVKTDTQEIDIKPVLEFIASQKDYLQTAEDLYTIYNRKLTPFIERRLDTDLKGRESRAEAKLRISAINVLPMVVDKLSHVYDCDLARKSTGIGTVEMENLLTSWQISEALMMANKMLNLHRCVAIEPVLESKRLRVIPAHRFLVMGDGTIDNVMKGFIKIIGTENAGHGPVEIYEMYTSEAFVSFNSKGEILRIQPNTYGEIPIAYITRDTVTLMPEQDVDTFNMVTLLPLLLTDGNFAIKFQCFSIIYTMNLDAKNMTLSPNAVWQLKSTGTETDKPELGVIKPSANIPDILEWIRAQFSLWLESRNIKLKSFGNSTASVENASGIAKAIDAADVSQDLTYQRVIFTRLEADVFRLMGLLLGKQITVATSFKMQNLVPETDKEKTEVIVLKKTNGLISSKQAIKEANRHMSQEEIQEMTKDIEGEKEDELRSEDEGSGQNEERFPERLPRENRA
jgi:hypothetical protein